MVAARRADLQRPAGLGLPPDVGQVEVGRDLLLPDGVAVRGDGEVVLLVLFGRRRFVAQDAQQPAQRACGNDLHVGDEFGLGGVRLRHDDRAAAPVRGCQHGGQDALDRADAPVQSELADQYQPCATARRDDLRRREQRYRDGQVEGRPLLRHARREERHRHMPIGPVFAGIEDGGADAVTGLAEGRVGEADQVQAGDAAGDRRLHVHDEAVHADQGHRAGLRERHQQTSRRWSIENPSPSQVSPRTSTRMSAPLIP